MWLASSLECRQAKMIVPAGGFCGTVETIAIFHARTRLKTGAIVSSSNHVVGAPSFSPYPTPELKAPLKALTLSENAQIPSAKSVE
jgi:hypothetical protein